MKQVPDEEVGTFRVPIDHTHPGTDERRLGVEAGVVVLVWSGPSCHTASLVLKQDLPGVCLA